MLTPKGRDTDSPCPFLQEAIGFSGKMYTIVRPVGLFQPCFWDCLCWFCCVPMPIIPHWPDCLGRNDIYVFSIDFVLGFTKFLYRWIYLSALPMTTENTWLHFLAVYTYLLSILSLPSANSEEVFPICGLLLFYLLSHGQQVALSHACFLGSLENETGIWKSMRNHFLPTKM